MKKLILFFFLFLLISCKKICDSSIEIPQLIIDASNEDHYPYCENVNLALKGNSKKVKELFTSDFTFIDGESGYCHGYVVMLITTYLGEDKILSIITDFSKDELNNYESFLAVGLDYDPSNVKHDGIRESFPKIYKFFLSVQQR